MRIGCKKYAELLLKDSGCELDCYRGTELSEIERDLKLRAEDLNKSLSNCYPYPVEDIAICLREIGDEQPEPVVEVKNWLMVFDTESCTDGIEFETREAAYNDMIETHILWMQEERHDWKFEQLKDGAVIYTPTEKQIEDWDYMIDNCCTWIEERDPETGKFPDGDDDAEEFLPDEELEKIRWMEWKEIKRKEIAPTLWDDFGTVPINDNDEIEESWREFPAGTNRFEIWTWFEDEFGISVALDFMKLEDC